MCLVITIILLIDQYLFVVFLANLQDNTNNSIIYINKTNPRYQFSQLLATSTWIVAVELAVVVVVDVGNQSNSHLCHPSLSLATSQAWRWWSLARSKDWRVWGPKKIMTWWYACSNLFSFLWLRKPFSNFLRFSHNQRCRMCILRFNW